MVVCRIHNTCHRVPIDLMFHLYVLVMIQLILTLKMTTAQVVETSLTVNNNSPIQDYVHPRHSYSTNLPSVVFTLYVADEIYNLQYASDTKSLLTRLIFVLQEKII